MGVKALGGAALGGAASYPTSELIHIGYTEIAREVRNKKPKLTYPVAEHSVASGYWPDQNDYINYRKQFGAGGNIAGFFVRNTMDNPHIINQIREAEDAGKQVAIAVYFPTHDPYRFPKYVNFAKQLKKVCKKPFYLRPNPEPNQRRNKTDLGIKDGADFIRWWIEFHAAIMNEQVDCKFMLCLNTTEELFNTDQVDEYIPPVGVDSVGFDTFKRYHRDPAHYKHILTNFTAYEQIGHDVAIVQERLPGIPWGISEMGCEDNVWLRSNLPITTEDEVLRSKLPFKAQLLRIAPYLGASFVMSFEWKKDNLGDPDEVDWRSIRNVLEHKAVLNALSTPAYMQQAA